MSSLTLLAMAALLRQGRRLERLSWLLAAAAIAWLLLAVLVCRGQLAMANAAMVASLVAALAQVWHAMRVDFDACVFDALAAHAATDDSAARLDAALLELGLIDGGKAGRDWPTRWRGARRLLQRQAICLALQAIALFAGLALGEEATCWNA